MFRGHFRHTIDPKGRLSIPAKFREALDGDLGDKLVIVPIDHSLEVHPLSAWRDIEAKVAALPKFDEDARKLKYAYLSRAHDVTSTRRAASSSRPTIASAWDSTRTCS